MRFLQVGLGPLGRKVMADIERRGLGRVVSAVDSDKSLIGKPLSSVMNDNNDNVIINGDLQNAIDAGGFDVALVCTSSWMDRCHDTFELLMRNGVSVVSTCEELTYPWLKASDSANKLDEVAKKHGGRLLGTGINPGFLMDTLPLVVTAVCSKVDEIEVRRIQDATTRRIPFQKKIGAGMTIEEFAAAKATGRFGHAGLEESMYFLANYLGLNVVSNDTTTLEPVIAETDIPCTAGDIKKGNVCGLLQTAGVTCENGQKIRYIFGASVGETNAHDAVKIVGEPSFENRIDGGIHGDIGTSSMVLNCVPSLLKSSPGLHTMATIPPARWIPPQ